MWQSPRTSPSRSHSGFLHFGYSRFMTPIIISYICPVNLHLSRLSQYKIPSPKTSSGTGTVQPVPKSRNYLSYGIGTGGHVQSLFEQPFFTLSPETLPRTHSKPPRIAFKPFCLSSVTSKPKTQPRPSRRHHGPSWCNISSRFS